MINRPLETIQRISDPFQSAAFERYQYLEWGLAKSTTTPFSCDTRSSEKVARAISTAGDLCGIYSSSSGQVPGSGADCSPYEPPSPTEKENGETDPTHWHVLDRDGRS